MPQLLDAAQDTPVLRLRAEADELQRALRAEAEVLRACAARIAQLCPPPDDEDQTR